MDKFTLNKEQLNELRSFIHSRGFKDPVIVMEILDHFACLVEEKMEANNKLSLQDAMYEAHAGFGIMGFRTLAHLAERERQKAFNTIFKKELKGILSSPKVWILLLLCGTVYYQLYMLLMPLNFDFFAGRYLLMVSYMLLMFISLAIIYRKVPGRKERFATGYGSVTDNGYLWWAHTIMVVFPLYPPGNAPVWPFAAIATIMILGLGVYLKAQYKTVVYAADEYKRLLDLDSSYDRLADC